MVYSYFLDYLNSLTNYQFYFFFFEFLFILFIIYLVITDDRFLLNRKIIFILIILFLIIFSFYIDKTPYLIIKDLFWYSLILNVSFIFHVLILDRIFHWCWKNHYEYLGFIVSRISFTLSLSGILTLLRILTTNRLIDLITFTKSKTILKIINYIYDILLFFKLIRILEIIWYIMRVILINFSITFQNYALLILGKNKQSITLFTVIRYIIIFTIFFTIAYLIGIPRLYVIWLCQSIYESYKYLKKYYEIEEFNYSSIIKIIRELKSYKYCIILLYNYYSYKYIELEKIYNKPYHKFFLFDLCKFILNPNLNRIWDLPLNYNLEYPIIKIYKFYYWKTLAINYCNITEAIIEEEKKYCKNPFERAINIRIDEGLYWCQLINYKNNLLIEILPDLIKNEEELHIVLIFHEVEKKSFL